MTLPLSQSEQLKEADALLAEAAEDAASHSGEVAQLATGNQRLRAEVARQRSLLAETAEVLREYPRGNLDQMQRNWWINQAKPLLDKLGERE